MARTKPLATPPNLRRLRKQLTSHLYQAPNGEQCVLIQVTYYKDATLTQPIKVDRHFMQHDSAAWFAKGVLHAASLSAEWNRCARPGVKPA